MSILVPCILGFLIGGIPFGYLLGRFLLQDDIRNHGSGNIGATNVGRVVGWKWGGLVLFLDALKGLLPTLWAIKLAGDLPPQWHWHLPVATGVCAILGHMYPIYLRLRGGKGVATALGVVLVLAPESVLIAFVVFVLIAATTKMVGLASMLAAIVFGINQLWLLGRSAFVADKLSLTAFSVGIPLLIIWRHRSNIVRMIQGKEPSVTDPAKKQEDGPDSNLPADRDTSPPGDEV